MNAQNTFLIVLREAPVDASNETSKDTLVGWSTIHRNVALTVVSVSNRAVNRMKKLAIAMAKMTQRENSFCCVEMGGRQANYCVNKTLTNRYNVITNR